jgi:hypothetical protein
VSTETAHGQLCVTVGPESSATVGWPSNPADALSLPPGTYELSYEISSSVPLTVEARFGVDITPYNDLNVDALEMPGTALQTFSNAFTLAARESSAGLAFNIQAMGTTATVCIAKVSLVVSDATTPD